MRVDKFLKVSRLVKRREVAKQLCLDSDIYINGKPAKPMSEINAGDKLFLKLGKHKITAEVKQIREYANKEQAEQMVQIIEDLIG